MIEVPEGVRIGDVRAGLGQIAGLRTGDVLLTGAGCSAAALPFVPV